MFIADLFPEGEATLVLITKPTLTVVIVINIHPDSSWLSRHMADADPGVLTSKGLMNTCEHNSSRMT